MFWPEVMEHFETSFNLKTGNTPGGNSYTGKVIRQIMAPEMLQELRMLLPDCDDNAAHLFIDYLEALRELHYVLVKPELDEEYGYEGVFENFMTAFEAVHDVWGLPETLKIHILNTHTLEYLSEEGQTLCMTNDEHLETGHQKVRYHELRHNFKCRKNVVGAYKKKRSLSSITSFNSFNKRLKKTYQ